MSNQIHPTAIVSSDTRLGENVIIGPYAIVNENVTIGDNTTIQAFSIIGKNAIIGKSCDIGPNAHIATETVDLSYKGEEVFTYIGDNTKIKEFAVVHNATKASGKTIIGSNCLIMAYTHIAHDCCIGDNIILANGVQLAGHVQIDNFAILGGMSKVHQFCRIGQHCMIGADAYLNQDAAPFTLIAANPNLKMFGLNKVGLKRRNFNFEVIKEIDNFYKILLRSGKNITDALKFYKENYSNKIIQEVQFCIDFIENSQRGIIK